ncbi:MAG TPA: NUDIX hydrolase [Solirubrobacteraceae bacterium]|nr:NUDIX hydrolase [Solirubrobacteraceae bacterium]
MSGFTPVGSEPRWQGAIITAGSATYRYADGQVVTRDKVWHPGAVGILALDRTHVWLTRQPREVAGMTDSLEIPAGKLDVAGEEPLQCARRELAEEIGMYAGEWSELYEFYSSAGFSDERVWLYLARELSPADGGVAPEDDERIEVVPWPLDELAGAIAACQDAKSLIALLWLTAELERGGPQPAR